jgi:HPt (histidine-containing phosphotransfer) domain-containing protein
MLRSAVAASDADATRRHAHAIAGAAGNLGADPLRHAAKALELAAKEGRADMTGLLNAVLEQEQKVLGSIERLHPVVPGAEDAAGPADDACDRPAVATALRHLAAVVDSADVTGCSETLAALAKFRLPQAMAHMLAEVRERIDGYEYDQAGQIVSRWLLALSGKDPR